MIRQQRFELSDYKEQLLTSEEAKEVKLTNMSLFTVICGAIALSAFGITVFVIQLFSMAKSM